MSNDPNSRYWARFIVSSVYSHHVGFLMIEYVGEEELRISYKPDIELSRTPPQKIEQF